MAAYHPSIPVHLDLYFHFNLLSDIAPGHVRLGQAARSSGAQSPERDPVAQSASGIVPVGIRTPIGHALVAAHLR
jgi:hypothetical protein